MMTKGAALMAILGEFSDESRSLPHLDSAIAAQLSGALDRRLIVGKKEIFST
jgi:hypothetical protein